MLNSARRYVAAFIEHNEPESIRNISVDDIINNKQGSESFYAMEDNIDAILDLKPGERLQMNFNRDNDNSSGFIQRVI